MLSWVPHSAALACPGSVRPAFRLPDVDAKAPEHAIFVDSCSGDPADGARRLRSLSDELDGVLLGAVADRREGHQARDLRARRGPRSDGDMDRDEIGPGRRQGWRPIGTGHERRSYVGGAAELPKRTSVPTGVLDGTPGMPWSDAPTITATSAAVCYIRPFPSGSRRHRAGRRPYLGDVRHHTHPIPQQVCEAYDRRRAGEYKGRARSSPKGR